MCMYTLCVCLPLYAGRELGVQQDFQNLSRVVFRTFCVRSECGMFQGQEHISSLNS